MTQYTTISPTHVTGKKYDAWNNFLKGEYIAIGWMDVDLTGKSIEEVISIIKEQEFEDESSAIDAFTKFLALNIGDYVAINNTNHGLFGVGQVTSDYRFQKYKHDSGADDKAGFYSNLRSVKWEYANYVKAKDIISPGETAWQPYGTIGKLQEEVPPYIKRLLGEMLPKTSSEINYVVPDYLKSVVRNVEKLKADPNHQERAHESIVEDFFCMLGYEKHSDIKYRQGRVDISIWNGNNPLIVVEVKRDWDLSSSSYNAINQAYNYALGQGTRYIIVTNGDYYVLFDRLKGLSYSSNIIGEFRLTALEGDDSFTIDRLKRENLINPNLEELFRNLSESFVY